MSYIQHAENTSARLGLSIAESPVFNADFQQIPGKKEIVMKRDNEIVSLDVVNETFSLPSLSRMESLAEMLHEQNGARGEIVSQWLAGSQTALYKVPVKEIEITRRNGKKDQQTVYVAVKAGFTGKCSRVYSAFFYRLVCKNGLMRSTEFAMSSIRNTKNAAARETLAEVNLSQFMEYLKREQDLFQILAQKVMSEKEMRALLTNLVVSNKEDLSKRAETKIDNIIALAWQGMGNGDATAYDLLNGVTEYGTHQGGHESTREESNLSGSNFRFSNQVYGELIRLTA